MFVVTVNKKKIVKVLAAVVCVVAVGAVGIGVKGFFSKNTDVSAQPKKLKLSTTQEMVKYIEDKGFAADIQTAEIIEVEIPKKFDENFDNFNEKIKQTDGLSLEKYKGDKVSKWTFDLIDYGKDEKKAVAVLLIKKEKLIGAYILEQPQGIAMAMENVKEKAAI